MNSAELQLTLTSDLPLEGESFLKFNNVSLVRLFFSPVCKKRLSCRANCKHAAVRNLSARNMSSGQNCKLVKNVPWLYWGREKLTLEWVTSAL